MLNGKIECVIKKYRLKKFLKKLIQKIPSFLKCTLYHIYTDFFLLCWYI